MANQHTVESTMPQSTIKSWANEQKDADTDKKRLVAAWASRHFRLNGASGVYLDAGTACLAVWKELAGQIVEEGHPSQIKVLTNNLMILNDFASNPSPLLYGLKMASVGDNFDVLHQAFFGPSIDERLRSGLFRPEVIYIGSNGISFSEDGAILFGFHAEDPEREAKELLFANPCKAKARIILATAKKVGNPGGTVFDILKVPDLDCKSPLYLLTTAPAEEERDAYEFAMRIFKTETMQRAIVDRGLKFHWIEIDGSEREAFRNITDIVQSDQRLMEGSCTSLG
jgi:DeoR/GlpR family transcriptional regulator of sugar metabolism